MRKWINYIVLFCFTAFSAGATSFIFRATFEQLDNLQKNEPRNVIVFIHTDWCSYCRLMEEKTFTDKKVAAMLQKNYYFLTINAGEKSDIFFAGKTFRYKPTGNNTGIHELAEQLGTVNNKISYPTLCILNHKNEIIFQYDKYLSASELEKILATVIENDKN